MKIVCHVGPHCMDDGQFLASVTKSRNVTRSVRVEVPRPNRYRRLINDTLRIMSRQSISTNARDILLDAMLDGETVERVVLSNHNFLGVARNAISQGELYRNAGRKCSLFETLFSNDEIEFFISIRSPVTFLPDLSRLIGKENQTDLLESVNPFSIRWSRVIQSIRRACNSSRVTVWSHEDAPIIWQRLMQSALGLPREKEVSGQLDVVSKVITSYGLERLIEYVEEKAVTNPAHLEGVISAFLSRYALDKKRSSTMAGNPWRWEPELERALTDQYHDDVETIRSMDGVSFVQPTGTHVSRKQ